MGEMDDARRTSRKGLPPGPSLPPALQALIWVFRPIRFLNDCARRYGDVFTVRFPFHPPYIFISDPAAIREIFAGNPRDLLAGEANQVLKPLVGARSVLMLDGERHRRERKLLMPAFHGDRMRAYGDTMRETADRHIDRWPLGEAFAVQPRFQRLTLDVILRTVFGIAEGGRNAMLREQLIRLLDFSINPALLFTVGRTGEIFMPRLQRVLGAISPLGRFVKIKERIDRALYDEFEERSSKGATGREDVLSMLLEARDERGRAMTYAELRDEMMTLLVAGHETTATALGWILYHVLERDGVRERILDELRSVTGGGPLASDEVSKLEYLDATIKETMRLNPVLPVTVRLLREPSRLGGFELPAGVVATPNVYSTHRRGDLWPDPERFRPERFLEKPAKPFHFLPFGGGNRTCLGMAFTYYEMKIVLAQLLRRTRLRVKPGYRARIVRRGITFAPSGGMPIIVDARN